MQDQQIPPMPHPSLSTPPNHKRLFLLVGMFSFLALFLLMTVVLQTKRSFSEQSEAKGKALKTVTPQSVGPGEQRMTEFEQEENLDQDLLELDRADREVIESGNVLLKEGQ